MFLIKDDYKVYDRKLEHDICGIVISCKCYKPRRLRKTNQEQNESMWTMKNN